MNMIRFNQQAEHPMKMFNNMFNEIFSPNMSHPFFYNGHISAHPLNIKEDESCIEMEMATPGFRKEDFQVNVQDEMLIIRAEVTEEGNEEKNNEQYVRKEFFKKSFKRSFTLPQTIEVDGIEATFEEGVLIVKLPKKKVEEKENAKSIVIK